MKRSFCSPSSFHQETEPPALETSDYYKTDEGEQFGTEFPNFRTTPSPVFDANSPTEGDSPFSEAFTDFKTRENEENDQYQGDFDPTSERHPNYYDSDQGIFYRIQNINYCFMTNVIYKVYKHFAIQSGPGSVGCRVTAFDAQVCQE